MNLWPLLSPLSAVYGGAVCLRNLAFDTGLLRSEKVEAHVISIGNLTAGGSGKTPVTIELTQRLHSIAQGMQLAIVSRGYKRHSRGVRIVADKNRVLLDAEEAGDEPLLIAGAIAEFTPTGDRIPVIVAERRAEGAQLAIERFSAKVILLDDAFQHRLLARDLDLVLIDATAPAWNWRLLPSGRMREPATGLKRAGLIAVTANSKLHFQDVARWIRRYNQAVPIIAGQLEPGELATLDGASSLPLHVLKDFPLAAACGIAKPERFFKTLEHLGARIVTRRNWPDHATPSIAQLENLVQETQEHSARVLVITMKDAVKWPAEFSSPLPIWTLNTRWRWTSGEMDLNRCLREALETYLNS